MPILYFTQMMGLAFGMTRSHAGHRQLNWWTRGRALAKIGVEVPPPPEAEAAPKKRKRDDKSLPMPQMSMQADVASGR